MSELKFQAIEDALKEMGPAPATWTQVKVDYNFLFTDAFKNLNYKVSGEFFIRLRKVYEVATKKTAPEEPEEKNIDSYLEWAYPLMGEIHKTKGN